MTTQYAPAKVTADSFKKAEPDATTSTERTCKFNLTNDWDVPITGIEVVHKSGDRRDTLTIEKLGVGETSESKTCHYETGWGASHDYWWIVFTAEDGEEPGTWTCKNNFYCDLRSEDEGKLVTTLVTAVDTDWYITEPSGRCYVSLDQE